MQLVISPISDLPVRDDNQDENSVQCLFEKRGFRGVSTGDIVMAGSQMFSGTFRLASAKLSPRILVQFQGARCDIAGELARRVIDLYKQVGFASDNYRASWVLRLAGQRAQRDAEAQTGAKRRSAPRNEGRSARHATQDDHRAPSQTRPCVHGMLAVRGAGAAVLCRPAVGRAVCHFVRHRVAARHARSFRARAAERRAASHAQPRRRLCLQREQHSSDPGTAQRGASSWMAPVFTLNAAGLRAGGGADWRQA